MCVYTYKIYTHTPGSSPLISFSGVYMWVRGEVGMGQDY